MIISTILPQLSNTISHYPDYLIVSLPCFVMSYHPQFSQEGQHVTVTDDNNENVVSLRNESTAEDTVPARPVRINAVSPDWAFTSGG